MPTDPQAPKVDERPQWTERVRAAVDGYEEWTHSRPTLFGMDRALRAAGLRNLIVERDSLRDAFAEIANARSLDTIAGIVANGPLATAPGGEREDECFRLREERDALRAEVERIVTLLDRAEVPTGDGDLLAFDRVELYVERLGEKRALYERAYEREKAQAARLAARVRELEGERDFYEERERYFAGLLKVSDLGRYRADWDGAVERVRAEGARQERERWRRSLGEIADQLDAKYGRGAPLVDGSAADLLRGVAAAVLSEEGS